MKKHGKQHQNKNKLSFEDKFATETINIFNFFYNNEFPKGFLDFQDENRSENIKEKHVNYVTADHMFKLKEIKFNKETKAKKQEVEENIENVSQWLYNFDTNIDDCFRPEKADRNRTPLYLTMQENTNTTQKRIKRKPMDMKSIVNMQTKRLEKSKQTGIKRLKIRQEKLYESIRNANH